MIGWSDGGQGGGRHWLGNIEKTRHRGTEGRRLGNWGKSYRDCTVWRVARWGVLCGTFGVPCGVFGVPCGALLVTFDLASAGGWGSGLAWRGISGMCGFPVFASVFAGDDSKLFIIFNIALNELWDDTWLTILLVIYCYIVNRLLWFII